MTDVINDPQPEDLEEGGRYWIEYDYYVPRTGKIRLTQMAIWEPGDEGDAWRFILEDQEISPDDVNRAWPIPDPPWNDVA